MVEGGLPGRVGVNLRRLRLGLGDTQEQFGRRVGWHRTLVGGVERGERNLNLRSVERLCARLGIDPVDLLAEPDARPDGEQPPAR